MTAALSHIVSSEFFFIKTSHCFCVSTQLAIGYMDSAVLAITEHLKIAKKAQINIIEIKLQAIIVLPVLCASEYSLFSQMMSVGSAVSLIYNSSPKKFICGFSV